MLKIIEHDSCHVAVDGQNWILAPWTEDFDFSYGAHNSPDHTFTLDCLSIDGGHGLIARGHLYRGEGLSSGYQSPRLLVAFLFAGRFQECAVMAYRCAQGHLFLIPNGVLPLEATASEIMG